MEWHIFKCVQNKGTSGKFLIDCKQKNFILELNIIQNTVAWSAEIQQDSLENLAKELKMEPTNYLKTLKEHLNSDNVEFQFAKNELVVNVPFNQIKVKYLRCKLSKVQGIFDCVNNLLQTIYDDKNNAIKELHTLKEETDCLRKSTCELEHKLNEFIARKKKEEDTLYSNFILVLNEKKSRIQHLTELLEAFRHGRPTDNPEPELNEKLKKSIKTSKVEVKNEVSESESEENDVDYNTDDENMRNEKLIEKKIVKENGDLSDMLGNNILQENEPSTSKKNTCSSFLDDSPPSYILPKRTKYSHKNEESISILSNFDTAPSKFNITKKEVESEEESQSNTYDTQDLLDQL